MIKNKPKKPIYGTLRNLDGTKRRTKIAYICRPNWTFKEPIEEYIWGDGVEDATIPLLKEEMEKERKGKRDQDVRYLYNCPYCDFQSPFFYCVDLHIAYSKSCYHKSKNYPYYPINHCIHKPTGRSYIP